MTLLSPVKICTNSTELHKASHILLAILDNFPGKCFRSIKFRKCYENVGDNAGELICVIKGSLEFIKYVCL